MKNGIFKNLTALMMGLFLIQLSSCASLLEFGNPTAASDDGTEYDRGYQSEAQAEGSNCEDGDCHTAAEDPFRTAASSSPVEGDGTHRVKRAIQTRDVILGMTRQDVMQSWGEPQQREVAGNGGTGHERWTYGSRFSLSNSRTVIFENGRVAGWNR